MILNDEEEDNLNDNEKDKGKDRLQPGGQNLQKVIGKIKTASHMGPEDYFK